MKAATYNTGLGCFLRFVLRSRTQQVLPDMTFAQRWQRARALLLSFYKPWYTKLSITHSSTRLDACTCTYVVASRRIIRYCTVGSYFSLGAFFGWPSARREKMGGAKGHSLVVATKAQEKSACCAQNLIAVRSSPKKKSQGRTHMYTLLFSICTTVYH